MTQKQQKLLAAILACVADAGWTEAALAQGIKDAKINAAEARKIFPRGIDDAVDAFHAMIDEAMHTRIKSKRNFPTLRVRDKITFALRARLEAIEPHRDAMRRLALRSVMPRHIRAATRQVWQAADAVWLAAGDSSTDYNYYTKRILLIAVMKSTLAFWLNDKSAAHAETWKFLDRRIADIMTLGKGIGIGIVKNVGVGDIVSFVRARFAA